MQALANVELFLRSKRKHYALMEKYNPLYGMSDKDRIRATARTVGLQVPTKDKPTCDVCTPESTLYLRS